VRRLRSRARILLVAAALVIATLTGASAGHAVAQARADVATPDLIAYSFRYWRDNGGDDWEVFLFDPATGSNRDLSRDSSCDDGYATWSHDRTALAYTCTSLVGEHRQLLETIAADGSGHRVWLRVKRGLGEPHFSPDGGHLAVTVGNTLAVITIADGSITPIVKAAGRSRTGDVAWSLDGTTIAFTRSSEKGVWLVNRDGRNLHRLFAAAAAGGTLAWSPTGTLAFEASRGRGVWLISPDGSNLRLLTRSLLYGFRFSWSADGSKLLYATADGGLARIGANGTGRRLLGVGADAASWSPDGTQIAYSADSRGLRRINDDGTHGVRLMLEDQILCVAWTS
jgi:hypothetical protein